MIKLISYKILFLLLLILTFLTNLSCDDNSALIISYQQASSLSTTPGDPLINKLVILQSVDNQVDLANISIIVVPEDGGPIIGNVCILDPVTQLLDCVLEKVPVGVPIYLKIVADDGSGTVFGKSEVFTLSNDNPVDITIFFSNDNRFSTTVKVAADGLMEPSELNIARQYHTATLLNDGTILIVGGYDLGVGDVTGSAEYYNPLTGEFIALAGGLNIPHAK